MMEETYRKAIELCNQLLQEGQDPLEIAAVMTTVGLSLYRTVLEPEAYENMVDTISENRDKVRELTADRSGVH